MVKEDSLGEGETTYFLNFVSLPDKLFISEYFFYIGIIFLTFEGSSVFHVSFFPEN